MSHRRPEAELRDVALIKATNAGTKRKVGAAGPERERGGGHSAWQWQWDLPKPKQVHAIAEFLFSFLLLVFFNFSHCFSKKKQLRVEVENDQRMSGGKGGIGSQEWSNNSKQACFLPWLKKIFILFAARYN